MTTTLPRQESRPGVAGTAGERRLVVVSNRVPPPSAISGGTDGRTGTSGGLVSALKPAMERQGGLWLGWSGKSTRRRPNPTPTSIRLGPLELATVDLSEDDVSLYYTGFANRTLWPLLHSFPERVTIRRDTYRAYRRVNQRFAAALLPSLTPDDLVWVHDYHLFHVGQELRQLGWEGKVGFFLHVPFPSLDIFSILPWSTEILDAMLSYDLVGVHTNRYLFNLKDTLRTQLGGHVADGTVGANGRSTRLGVYHIGIDVSTFERPDDPSSVSWAKRLLTPASPDHRLILGVDRLDYTKGIPERLRAFERMLEQHPSLRGRVSFVQISSPSRTRVPEYIREKERVDQLVGQINGRFSEGGWVPIRYVYRSVPQDELARFYRDSHVALVTPLRDGLNLVAKEFVASQGDDPGVLVLSQFSGAASTMHEALIVNPHDIDRTADAIYAALTMPADERQRRWRSMMRVVRKNDARSWSESFQSDLAGA